MELKKQIEEMIVKARIAQKEYEKFDQKQVDKIVKIAARAIYDHGLELAEMTQEETNMGTLDAKIAQNTSGITWMYGHLKGKKSRGILRRDEGLGIIELAKPLGVVACISPVTSAIPGPAHTIMIALKCGNAVVVSPHPAGKKSSAYAVKLMAEAITKAGAPENLIQVLDEPSVEASKLIMGSADVIVAIGGPGLVKSAYSSGKPSFGVGPGNVQALIDEGEDMVDVANKVIRGKTFNFGVPCTSTNFVHVSKKDYPAFMEAFEKLGGYFIDDEESLDKLREALFPEGETSRPLVGKTPQVIGEHAGVKVPETACVLGLGVKKYGRDELLAKEKLFPVTAIRAYDTWEEAVEVAETNLQYEGKGHSCAFFSHNQKHIEYAAERLSVSRFAVNLVTTESLGGTKKTGLAPTAALGCGSWGGNSISENLDYKHMMNVCRITYERPVADIPGDDEIWAEED